MASNNVLEFVREDDYVEYYIFPIQANKNSTEEEEQLQKILTRAKNLADKLTKNHLWHKDNFSLSIRTKHHNILSQANDQPVENLPAHVYGVTHFGENIEDEWLIVHILLEITREIPEIIARIVDSDGEFLLIESANFLPQWADPETCEKRVYIHRGQIHLIPLEEAEEIIDGEKICVREALDVIERDPDVTLAPDEIQTCIARKVSVFPDKISENLHRVNAYLPVGVAAILRQHPHLISPAIQAFCNRDTVDSKYCKAMKYFPPENRVQCSVTMTRCLYAMLSHTRYQPDSRTGWNLPKQDSPQFKAHYLGVKIASGFEILASQAKPSQSLDEDKNWNKFLQKLQEKGFFKGLLEKSEQHSKLMSIAEVYYREHSDSMRVIPKVGSLVLDLIKTLDYKIDDLRKQETELVPEDPDDWLDISADELDRMLEEKYGGDFTKVNNNSNATELTEKLTNFLDHSSGIEGVEHPQRPPRGVKRNKVSFAQDTKTDTKGKPKIDFDPNAFTCAVQNILNFVIPEDDNWDLESESDMSDYAEDDCVKEESYENAKSKMEEYMEQMDRELAATTIGDSFTKKNGEKTKNGDAFDDIEDFTPVDIDVNALENMLQSYKSQLGAAGPSSNMLGPMGIHLSNDDD